MVRPAEGGLAEAGSLVQNYCWCRRRNATHSTYYSTIAHPAQSIPKGDTVLCKLHRRGAHRYPLLSFLLRSFELQIQLVASWALSLSEPAEAECNLAACVSQSEPAQKLGAAPASAVPSITGRRIAAILAVMVPTTIDPSIVGGAILPSDWI